jgi:regulator of sigma E protease
MAVQLHRGSQELNLEVTPQPTELTDRFGYHHTFGLLGISRNGVEYVRHDPLTAIWRAGDETLNVTTGILDVVWQIVIGLRTTEDLGGPLRIAQLSGVVAQEGILPVLGLMALLSVNLGLINLFPIPVLDGGHLLFYAAEAIRGRPLGARAQEYGFRLGLALVLTLMVFVTWNDLVQMRIVEFLKGLVT